MKKQTKIFLVVIAAVFVFFTMAVCTAAFFKIYESSHRSSSDYVAVMELSGVIMDATEFLKELNELVEDENLKAIVVRIDSPGGLVAPSEEIHYALREANKKKPIIASMGTVAASGGYYAACAARKIFANAGTLTASIGVIMELANTSRLFEWAKVDRYVLKAGKFKDIGSPLRTMTPEERELMQGLLTTMHEDFRAKVKEGRNLTEEDLENVADGRVLTGLQALKVKLVDEIGPLEKAIAYAKKEGGLDEDAFVYRKRKEEGFLRKALFGEESANQLGRFLENLSYLNPAPGPRFLYLMTGY